MENNTQTVGVIGAGSFGTAIANLLAHNVNVLLFSRKLDLVNKINQTHQHHGLDLVDRVRATNNLAEVAQNCPLIFPVVPSTNFREMIRNLSPFLKPYHLLIHGTKGFDLGDLVMEEIEDTPLSSDQVYTMSQVIRQETVVVRIGCLSGPNLASEIIAGQPTATVIGSQFNEVIKAGRKVLDSKKFKVFGTHDMLGAELAGALKNAIAIGSGILNGRGMGKNIQAMLITRGLVEMVYIGRAMGSDSKAFIGTAGIGDLIATATSSLSRNFTFGKRLAGGDNLDHIIQTMPELAEGVRTIKIMWKLAKFYKLHTPITQMLHAVVFESFDIDRALEYLISYPYAVDVDFL